PALLLVVAPVEDVPLAAAGKHPLRHAGPGELVEPAVEREPVAQGALRLGQEEPVVADLAERLVDEGPQDRGREERARGRGARHSAPPLALAMRCFTSCSTRRRSSSSRRTPGAPCRTTRAASAWASASISASSVKLRFRIAATRARIASSGAVG